VISSRVYVYLIDSTYYVVPAVPDVTGEWVELLSVAGSPSPQMLPHLLAQARTESEQAGGGTNLPLWNKAEALDRWARSGHGGIRAWHVSWRDDDTIKIMPLVALERLDVDTGYHYTGEMAEIPELSEILPMATDLGAVAQRLTPGEKEPWVLGAFRTAAPSSVTPGDLPAVVGQLLAQLQQDIPAIAQAAVIPPAWGWGGSWSPQDQTVFLPAPTSEVGHQIRVLLHEAGHAVLGHVGLTTLDIDTHIEGEKAAWEKAHELARRYRVGRYLQRRFVEAAIDKQDKFLRRLLWAVGKIAGTDRAYPVNELLIAWMREDGLFPNRGQTFLDRLEQHPEYYALRDRSIVFDEAWPTRRLLHVPPLRLGVLYPEGNIVAGVLRQVVEGTFPQLPLACIEHHDPDWTGPAYLLDGRDYPSGGYSELIGLVHQEALAQRDCAIDWTWFSPNRKVREQPCIYLVEVVRHHAVTGPAFIFVPGPDPTNVEKQALLAYVISLGRRNSFRRRNRGFASWEECRAFALLLQQHPWDDEVLAPAEIGTSDGEQVWQQG